MSILLCYYLMFCVLNCCDTNRKTNTIPWTPKEETKLIKVGKRGFNRHDIKLKKQPVVNLNLKFNVPVVSAFPF